jgi:hypothetical protein
MWRSRRPDVCSTARFADLGGGPYARAKWEWQVRKLLSDAGGSLVRRGGPAQTTGSNRVVFSSASSNHDSIAACRSPTNTVRPSSSTIGRSWPGTSSVPGRWHHSVHMVSIEAAVTLASS